MRKIEADTLDLEAAFDSTGIKTATQNSTTDHDYKLPDDLNLDGGAIITWGANKGDTIVCQVVDVDGIALPAGTVIKTWVTKWAVSTVDGASVSMTTNYKGLIPKDMYLRVKYTSTSATTDAEFAINYRLHRVI